VSRSLFRTVAVLVAAGLLLPGLAAGAAPAGAVPHTAAPPRTAPASMTESTGQAAGKSLNSRFRGVNWADPRDNFIQDNNVPSGLSANDDYATTYRKSTQILGQFKSVLHANTVRLGINKATVTGAWWQSYRAIIDAATALHVNVILSVWPDRTFMLVEPNAIENFYATWQVVINDYGTHDNVYLDLVNEPQGYSDDPSGWVLGSPTNWRDVAAGWLAHFPAFPRSRVIIAGTGPGGDWYLGSVGNDHRLDGTLLELHVYSAFGLSFDTYREWKDWFRGQIAGFESRTIVGEFGTTLNRGADFNGPRDGSNPVAYMYAVTDTIRESGLGTVFWPGFRQNDTWNMLTFTGNGTEEEPFVGHVVNQSADDRLEWAYGLGNPAPAAIVSPASAEFVAGVAHTFTVSASGYPVAKLKIDRGRLPRGLRFIDLGNGMATVSGRASPAATGTYHLVVSARQPGAAPVRQALTITVVGSASVTTGAISGRIVNAVTKRPVENAELLVYLPPYGASAQGPKKFAYTKRDGTFRVDGVAPGSYIVQLRDPRYRAQWFGGTADPATAQAVEVTAGTITSGVDYRAVPVK
jgi:Carboxypeptidase regulatory-like domain